MLIAFLFALSFWGPYVHLLGGFSNLAPLYAFVVGVLLHFRGEAFYKSLSPANCAVFTIIAAAMLGTCGIRKQTTLVIALECIGSAMIVGLIAFKAAAAWLRLLDFSAIRFFGRVSYSFYLLHVIGMSLALRLIADGVDFRVKIFAEFTLAVAITTPMAWLSWRFIEKPFIALGRALDTHSRVSRPTFDHREHDIPPTIATEKRSVH
jgi:peptidoglycan/LPS O-acetylase OafA/YrhL